MSWNKFSYNLSYDLMNKHILLLKSNINTPVKEETMEELNNIKNSHQIGDSLTIKVNRNGKELDLTVTLQEQ